MRRRTLLALLMMAVLLMTTACSLVVKDETADGKRIVVDVAGRTLEKSSFLLMVENTLDYYEYYNYMYQMYGMTTETFNREAEYAGVVQTTFDSVVNRFVQLNKAVELGLSAYTEEDLAAIQTMTQEAYDSYLEQIKSSYFADTALEGDALTAALTAKATELNITLETCREEAEPNYLIEKLNASVIQDVTVSDEEVVAAFDANVNEAYAAYIAALMHLNSANVLTDEVLTDEEAAAATADSEGKVLGSLLLKHLMADKWGLDPFTAEEEAAFDAQAQPRYDAYLASISAAYGIDAADQEALNAKATALGITLSNCRDEAINTALVARITAANEAYAALTEPTEAVTALNTARTTALNGYRSAQALYGSSYNYNSSVYFAPEGYRYVKQILIAPAVDESGAKSAAQTAQSEAQTALSTLQNALTALQSERDAITTEIANYQKSITDTQADIDDTEDPKNEEQIQSLQETIANLNTQIADAQARLDAKQAEVDAKQAEVDAQQVVYDAAAAEFTRLNDISFENAMTTVAQVQAALAAGENVDALIAQYGTDTRLQSEPLMTTGYAVAPTTTTMNASLIQAALALDTVGAYSEPIRTTQGWHIMIYAGDLQSGVTAFENEREALSASTLTTKQEKAFSDQVQAWITEATDAGQVHTYPDRLN